MDIETQFELLEDQIITELAMPKSFWSTLTQEAVSRAQDELVNVVGTWWRDHENLGRMAHYTMHDHITDTINEALSNDPEGH
jgi:hypothetical protein